MATTYLQPEVSVSNDGDKILCKDHGLEKCNKCQVDWTEHNLLAATLKHVKDLPPPNAPNPTRNAQVTRLKEEGNKYFKQNNYTESIRFYTMAVDLSWSRPLWEPLAFQYVREELAPVLSNRSAAHLSLQNYVDAYVDAEMVTRLKREWSKGWFRKGKALVGLGRVEEAAEAFQTGLRFDHESEELKKALLEIGH
ncbi:tetratricopeptide repeat domain containing protein [Mucor ambiguus]|uniref:Tetratricopeptide repeat domain containing protein n=1 Tax=Mucor ambiguus TaxID=91626 RepID=A0A0C9MV49_9FUNG|nr:tetratricopeptide repeat domain containing protein [Mucor ambiguus]